MIITLFTACCSGTAPKRRTRPFMQVPAAMLGVMELEGVVDRESPTLDPILDAGLGCSAVSGYKFSIPSLPVCCGKEAHCMKCRSGCAHRPVM